MTSLIVIILLLNTIIYFYKKKISKKINIFATKYSVEDISEQKIPVIGGTILYINFFVIFIFLLINKRYELIYLPLTESYREIFAFFIPISIIYLTGLYDDRYKLSIISRLLLFIFSLLIAISLDQTLIITELKFSFHNKIFYLDNLSLLFTILCFLIALNAFNLFDGINLQLSVYTIIIISYLLTLNGGYYVVSILLLPLFFFTILNYKNSAILGDGGSLTLGFLVSYLIIKYYKYTDNLMVDHIFVLLMIPGIDMLRLFISRITSGKSPFFGDYNHIHHILHKKLSLHKTLLVLHGTLLFLILSLMYNFNTLFVITIYISLYIIIIHTFKIKVNDK